MLKHIARSLSPVTRFLRSRRPGFIFAPDKEEFDAMRGFYYPLEETPFPVAVSNRQLRENVLAFDEAAYKARTADFLRGKGSLEDGRASARVVDLIQSIIEGGAS
jgi:CDP-glycerol glycerophosphotransferase